MLEQSIEDDANRLSAVGDAEDISRDGEKQLGGPLKTDGKVGEQGEEKATDNLERNLVDGVCQKEGGGAVCSFIMFLVEYITLVWAIAKC